MTEVLRIRAKCILVLLALMSLLAGCGSLSGAPERAVRGMAMTDAPLSGATVRIIDDKGRELATGTTDGSGWFEASVKTKSGRLRFLVTGGETGNATFNGTLSAYEDPFDEDLQVSVTPMTTIVDRVRVSGNLTLQQAEQLVAEYFGLEPGVSVRSDFANRTDFNSGLFMEAAGDDPEQLFGRIIADVQVRPDNPAYSYGLVRGPQGI